MGFLLIVSLKTCFPPHGPEFVITGRIVSDWARGIYPTRRHPPSIPPGPSDAAGHCFHPLRGRIAKTRLPTARPLQWRPEKLRIAAGARAARDKLRRRNQRAPLSPLASTSQQRKRSTATEGQTVSRRTQVAERNRNWRTQDTSSSGRLSARSADIREP